MWSVAFVKQLMVELSWFIDRKQMVNKPTIAHANAVLKLI